MLTLEHIKEVIERALAHIEGQRSRAEAQADADRHQYAGAAEGVRFVGSLLGDKVQELSTPKEGSLAAAPATPGTEASDSAAASAANPVGAEKDDAHPNSAG